MNLGKRELLFMLLLMAIPVGAWWSVFRPQNELNQRMRQQIEAKQTKLQSLNRLTGTIGDLKEEIGSLEEAIGFFDSKLPREKEIDRVLQEIWTLAEASDLQTQSIQTKGTTTRLVEGNGRHGEATVSVKLEGDFMGLYEFLLALEKQPRITRITDMQISKAGKKNAEGHMTAGFLLSVFYERGETS